MDAQHIVTLAILLLAAAYLVRRAWRRLSGQRAGGCGPCSRCDGATDAEGTAAGPVIPGETLIASTDQPKQECERECEREPSGAG